MNFQEQYDYSKTCLKRSLKKKTKIGFQDRLLLNAGQKYCRMNWSILQYFRPSLSYHLSLRSLFCPFLSGRLRQILLYDHSYVCCTVKISVTWSEGYTACFMLNPTEHEISKAHKTKMLKHEEFSLSNSHSASDVFIMLV